MSENENKGLNVDRLRISKREHFRKNIGGQLVYGYFGGSAFIAILILLLITVFLFREAFIFFPMEQENQVLIRQSGMELSISMHEDLDEYFQLLQALQKQITTEEAKTGFPPETWTTYQAGLLALGANARNFVLGVQGDARERVQSHSARTKVSDTEIAAWAIASLEGWVEIRKGLHRALALEPMRLAEIFPRKSIYESWHTSVSNWYIGEETDAVQKLEAAMPWKTVRWYESLVYFFSGEKWITNTFNQNRFGLFPLISGTIVVAIISLLIAIPLGVGSAFYVNHFARNWERKLLKPSLEFISAFPTVFLGFFGVVVWGDFLQRISQNPVLSWLPWFPYFDRLNAFTAGTLLAVMAIPIIFTLAEDALNEVPRDYLEASYSVGATRMQTLIQVVLPSASQGIFSAILLGFARIIGETMIVLLVAGNRIMAPDWSMGPGVAFEPVHTMTGIIAQEMGEVTFGGLHYRALFLVGAVLFVATLILNYIAEKLTRRLRTHARPTNQY